MRFLSSLYIVSRYTITICSDFIDTLTFYFITRSVFMVDLIDIFSTAYMCV